MYYKKTAKAMLDKFTISRGWTPTYHSIEEVDEFNAYVKSIITVESNSKNSYVTLNKPISESRQKNISKWIENEQILCCCDYSYWESRYAYVKTETGEIVRFKNRKAQEILDSIISGFEDRNEAKELVILGSRQTGVATKFMLMCTYRALFSPNSSVLVSSANPEISSIMEGVLETAYNRCPWWLVPSRLPRKSFSNGSVFSMSSSPNIVQGWTPNCVYIHNAESFRDPIMMIEEGIFREVQSSPSTMLVIHGNMMGANSWVRNFWNHSKEYYPKGMARFMPVFLPWYVSSDIYPNRGWIARFPVPKGFKPNEITQKHVVKCEAYARNTPTLLKALGKGWKMSIEQKWYWEYSYNYAKAIDNVDRFLSMMAADDSDVLANTEVDDRDIDLDILFPNASETQKRLGKDQ